MWCPTDSLIDWKQNLLNVESQTPFIDRKNTDQTANRQDSTEKRDFNFKIRLQIGSQSNENALIPAARPPIEAAASTDSRQAGRGSVCPSRRALQHAPRCPSHSPIDYDVAPFVPIVASLRGRLTKESGRETTANPAPVTAGSGGRVLLSPGRPCLAGPRAAAGAVSCLKGRSSLSNV